MATFNVPRLLQPYLPLWLGKILFGLACTAAGVVARAAIDHWVIIGAGTYSLAVPFILIATLFGGWRTGLLTLMLSMAHAWLIVMPAIHYLGQPVADQFLRMIVNVVALALVVGLTEIFRWAAQDTLATRDGEIADLDLYLSEFEHRTKNNFASVVALLELQRTRAGDEAAAQALEEAKTRVESMARAHLHLYRDTGSVVTVDGRNYLNGLCDALSDGIYLPPGVQLHWEADSIDIERDRVISIGLLVNELVTNAAKHAFSGRQAGQIRVALKRAGSQMRLSVADNGVGAAQLTRDGGLGQRLIDAFVRQLSGKLSTETGAGGSRFLIEMPI